MHIENKTKIEKNDLFYNPEMEINRDIISTAVGVLKVKKMCDGHSASGIKGIRCAMENDIEKVYLVDYSEKCFNTINKNIEINKIEKKCEGVKEDINKFLMDKKFDFIEIDPFGTPVPHLYYVLESVSMSKENYFSVTATDVQVLCGPETSACERIYGVKRLRNECVHEWGLRTLITKVQKTFAEKNIAVYPLLSLSHKHYLKIIFKTEKDAEKTSELLKKHKHLMYCEKCKNRKYIQIGETKKCNNCGNERTIIRGLFYSGLMHDTEFVEKMIEEIQKRNYKNKNEEIKFLNKIKNENFEGMCFDLHNIFKGQKIPKTEEIFEKIKSKKYATTQYNNNWIIRTNASFENIKN
jgi:tRNA (guanine26-N2/guanine27-N2)-dimethyltransferase